MVRLVALALNAHKLQDVCNGDGTLAFGAGLSNPDEPDVSLRDFTGQKRLWIEVGQPEDKPLIKACGKADEVMRLLLQPRGRNLVARHREQAARPQNLQRVPRADRGLAVAGARWRSAACSCRRRSRKAR